MTDMLIYYLVL